MPQKSFFIQVHGCKVNRYEAQALREAWLAQGLAEADSPETADMAALLTCAVTAAGAADGRSAARSLSRRCARTLVTGCAATVEPDSFRQLAGVEVIPNAAKTRLLCPGNRTEPAPEFFSLSASVLSRALVAVQDGCSNRCRYCIVPAARGPARSRPLPDILAEARRLALAGHAELVLTGVNLSAWREEGGDLWDLAQALEDALSDLENPPRLRLSSLTPKLLTSRALRAFSRFGQGGLVVPHAHVSLQSGSPDVLRAMGRDPEGPARLAEFCRAVADFDFPFGLGADVLVGFPGETESFFSDTMGLLERLPFTTLHVFPYSKRPGTPAASLPGQVEGPLLRARAALARQTGQEGARAFAAHVAARGRVLEVVAEKPGEGVSAEYLTVRLDPPLDPGLFGPGRPGPLVRVAAREARDESVWGGPVA